MSLFNLQTQPGTNYLRLCKRPLHQLPEYGICWAIPTSHEKQPKFQVESAPHVVEQLQPVKLLKGVSGVLNMYIYIHTCTLYTYMHIFDLYTPGVFYQKKGGPKTLKHQIVVVPPLPAMPVSFAPRRNFGKKIQKCPKRRGGLWDLPFHSWLTHGPFKWGILNHQTSPRDDIIQSKQSQQKKLLGIPGPFLWHWHFFTSTQQLR